jgi:thioredoxin 1
LNTYDDERDGQRQVLSVSDVDFSAKALAVEHPVVVEVGAPECAPCRLMDPIFADLAREYHGRILFAALDADDSPRTAMAYGVQGLPTFLIFHHGKLVAQLTGARSRADLKRRLEQALAAAID